MTCQEERFQYANKEKVIHHFRQLLTEAMIRTEERIATTIPKKEREARLLDKKYQSQKKQSRQKLRYEE